jgi:transposase
MRKSFRGLTGVVRQRLAEDPLSGHLFCFINRRRNMIKCLFADRTGMTIHYRKLARGTFELPAFEEGTAKVEVDSATLALILEGIELKSAVRRKRHTRGR